MYENLGFEVKVIKYFGYINFFSIKWDAIVDRSLFFKKIGLPLLGKLNGFLFYAQKISPSIHTKLFSPFILAIGVKKENNVRT